LARPITTAFAASNSEGELWLAAEDESTQKNSLYKLNTKEKKATHVLDLEGRVNNLTSDCKGNLWILTTKGTFVYESSAPAVQPLAIDATAFAWPATFRAIATTCHNDETIVWLGGDGIYRLSYTGSLPTADPNTAIQFQ